MRSLDLGSWHGLLTTLAGLALVTLIGVGVRLLTMVTIQQRRERVNRQINERLRTLIAAYKVLGGSFTGNLAVDPAHLRDRARVAAEASIDLTPNAAGSDRTRRIRDAVEAALSDIILLGTEAQVAMAAAAATELAAGRPVHIHALVVSLRDFVREALDLDPIPAGIVIPDQGPARPSGAGGGGRSERGKDEARSGGGGGSAGGGDGGGGGLAGGVDDPDEAAAHHR